jgi:CRP/FNR family cyclic AMP-dependent transcriptional regulator
MVVFCQELPRMSRRRGETWGLLPQHAELWIKSAHLATHLSFSAGQIMYQQGEVSPYFFFILEGEVRVSILEASGEETIIETMGVHAVCGEGPAFDGLPRYSTATVVTDARVLRFDARRLRDAFAQNPDLAMSILQITGLKQRALAVRLEYAFSHGPEHRVGQLLHRLAEFYGRRTPEGQLIDVYLTHEQIARMTGTSRVTVTRIIKRLRRSGTIDIRKGYVLVVRSHALVPEENSESVHRHR